MNNNEELRLPPEYEERVTGWLKKVKFRKRIFGGVSETDIWKKISELNDMYRDALIAERARCDALIAEYAAKAASSEKALADRVVEIEKAAQAVEVEANMDTEADNSAAEREPDGMPEDASKEMKRDPAARTDPAGLAGERDPEDQEGGSQTS